MKLLFFLIFLFFSITISAKNFEGGPISVVVSIPPQKYFVERIAGNLAQVTVMVPKGFEPEDYEPRPQQLKALNHAQLYFAIDVPFELNWLKKFQALNPNMKLIFTNIGIVKIKPTHIHHHSSLSYIISDPHIWLSPKLVQIQAKHIQDAFVQIDPKNSEIYKKNYRQFAYEIQQLDRSIKKVFEKNKNKGASFLIFHPSLGYFAKDYGLTQIAVEKEGKSPTLRQLQELVELAKKQNIHVIFITPEYAPKEAEIFAHSIHGKTQLIDPLSESWMTNMKHIAYALSQSLNQ